VEAVRGTEWYLPRLGIHDSYESWIENGSKSLEDDIRQELTRILSSHRPVPLPEKVEKELALIRSKAMGV
jgi:trimethylamine:corrinoid methyltransferase-like protein